MTDIADRRPGFDRAITWTGVGAMTALVALLLMLSAFGFEGSSPRADNVGEDGISAAIGVFGLILALVVALPTGWALARRGKPERRWMLRALPLIVGILWLGLAAIALYSGAAGHLVEGIWQRADHAVASPGLVLSIYTIGAIPIGLALLITCVVLVVIRAALILRR